MKSTGLFLTGIASVVADDNAFPDYWSRHMHGVGVGWLGVIGTGADPTLICPTRDALWPGMDRPGPFFAG